MFSPVTTDCTQHRHQAPGKDLLLGEGVPLLQPPHPHHLGCPLGCPLGCSVPDLGPASWNSHYLIFLLWTVSGWATVLRRPIRGRVDKWFSQSIISTKAKDKVGLVDLLMTLSGLSIPLIISQSNQRWIILPRGTAAAHKRKFEMRFVFIAKSSVVKRQLWCKIYNCNDTAQ